MQAHTSHEKAVRLSVRHTWIVTKRQKLVPTFLYHMRDYLS